MLIREAIYDGTSFRSQSTAARARCGVRHLARALSCCRTAKMRCSRSFLRLSCVNCG